MPTDSPSYLLTFDVGGSHVGCGLVRLADLELLRLESAALAPVSTFDGFVELIHSLGLKTAGEETSIAGASFAMPGPFDFESGVSWIAHKIAYLYGQNLRSSLAVCFDLPPESLQFLNDAAAYVLGEVGGGSLRGAARAVGLTLGTGVGAAFTVNGCHLREGAGVPPGGEIWDLPYAGGTVEDLISTRAIQAGYTARTGQVKEVVEIARLAPADSNARAVFETFGRHLGEVLRDVIAPFHPDRVMLGGGISLSAPLFMPAAQAVIAGLGFGLVTSTLLELAPLVGAAQYWRELRRSASVPAV